MIPLSCSDLAIAYFLSAFTITVTFTEEAIREIRTYSTGIPRKINLLCNKCLLNSYLNKIRIVSVKPLLFITSALVNLTIPVSIFEKPNLR